jgi:hypothetical protein
MVSRVSTLTGLDRSIMGPLAERLCRFFEQQVGWRVVIAPKIDSIVTKEGRAR